MKRNFGGFTLIELLVVIAVIGLLSSIVLVNMGLPTQRQKARIAKTLEFSQSIQNALGSEAVGIWEFDEGSGGLAKDRSGYGNNGTINGAVFTDNTPQKVISQSAGKYALSFDGVDDYVDAVGSSLNITKFITVEGWFNPNILLMDGSIDGMIMNGWAYSFYTQNGKLSGFWYNADPGAKYLNVSTPSLSVNTWYHFAFTYDYLIGTGKLYLNGVLGATRTDGNGELVNSGTTVKIGRSSWANTFFLGLIDEVRIYSQALSVAQIQQHYAEGLEKHQNLAAK